MGIKRLLIDSRIQGGWTVWYGHILKQARTDAGTGRRGRPRATRGCRVRDASLQQHVQWLNDCCGSQRVGLARWVVTPMTPWASVHSIDVDRVTLM